MSQTFTHSGYPVFTNVEKYRRMRCKRSPLGWLKWRSEQRALERCIGHMEAVKTICDIPTGPGRLFPFWKRMGLRVYGMDYSPSMVEAGRVALIENGLQGLVLRGDAFNIPAELCGIADAVVSIRFVYYFDRATRVALMQSLAAASRRYVLVQYKTTQTIKGAINTVRKTWRNLRCGCVSGKYFCSDREIRDELASAGLSVLNIVPISTFSDRVLVLGEKTDVCETAS